jgi:hypothetical protein
MNRILVRTGPSRSPLLARAALGLLPFAASVAACAPNGSGSDASEKVERALSVDPAVLLFNDTFSVPVCFLAPSHFNEETRVTAAITQQWGGFGLDLQGFLPCAQVTDPRKIPIQLVDVASEPEWGGSSTMGRGARTAENPNAQIIIRLTPNRRNLEYTAVREMGHALGLMYEHQRPDRDEGSLCFSPTATGPNLPIVPGKRADTPYDQNSIMNFCRDSNFNGILDTNETTSAPATISPLDVIAFKALYGTPPGAQWEAAFLTTTQTTGTFTPVQSLQYNSRGGINFVTTRPTGVYRVTLPRMGSLRTLTGGNVMVSSAFNGANRCSVDSFGLTLDNGGIQVDVSCFTPAGGRVPGKFSLSYIARTDTAPAGGAYASFSDTTHNALQSDPYFTWGGGSTGMVTGTRFSVGGYTVNLFKPIDTGTAYVTARPLQLGDHCKVDAWVVSLTVRCYDKAGVLKDIPFMVRSTPDSLTGSPSYAYALADQPFATTSYVPTSSFRRTFQQLAGTTDVTSPITVGRKSSGLSTGAYRVNFPGMMYDDNRGDGKANVLVTGYGSTPNYCNIDNWSRTATGGYATVNCYTPTGMLADTPFLVMFSSTTAVANRPRVLANAQTGDNFGNRNQLTFATSIESDYVYFGEFGSTPGAVRKVRRDGGFDPSGGPAQVTLVSGVTDLTCVLTTSTDVVYSSDTRTGGGGIFKVSKSGGTPVTLFPNPGNAGTEFLAINATDAFFPLNPGPNGSIMKVSLSGGPAVALATGINNPQGLSVDSSFVYFVSVDGTVNKVGINGGARVVLASGDRPSGFPPVLDSQNVYWSGGTSSFDVHTVSKAGGPVTTLAGTTNGGVGAVDEKYLYFAVSDDGTVKRYTLASGSIVTLAAKQGSSPRIAGIDATHVYFTTSDHILQKVLKEPSDYLYRTWAFDQGTSSGYASGGDWASGEFKGGCATTEWSTGVSTAANGTGRAHSLLCASTETSPLLFTSNLHTLTISAGDAGAGTHLGFDWASGFYKGECALNEVVVGLSQSTSNGALLHVRCGAVTGASSTNCRAVTLPGSGDNRESPAALSDWAYGYYKAECANGSAVAGVSRDTSTGAIHSILCCDFAVL